MLSSVGYCQGEKSDTQLIIDKLKNGESYTIIVESKGYIYYSDTLVINKNFDLYYLQFNGKTNDLSLNNLGQIRDFEIKINNCCSHFGCSETSNYKLLYKNEIIEFSDDGCELDRVSSLLRKLNIEYR